MLYDYELLESVITKLTKQIRSNEKVKNLYFYFLKDFYCGTAWLNFNNNAWTSSFFFDGREDLIYELTQDLLLDKRRNI